MALGTLNLVCVYDPSGLLCVEFLVCLIGLGVYLFARHIGFLSNSRVVATS
jgi:hypothetical protein